MTARRPCPPAPGPLEDYAAAFDDLCSNVAQRRSFRTYQQGLLLPPDRLKTLTGLAGAEPTVQAQAAEVQRLQFFLSESTWDADAVNARRVELLMQEPDLRTHDQGVLVLDDTGDRKKGSHTLHVGRQYLGSVGKIDNGIVTVTSLWPTSASTTPCTSGPSHRRAGSRRGRATRPTAASRSARWSWWMRRRPLAMTRWNATSTARSPIYVSEAGGRTP